MASRKIVFWEVDTQADFMLPGGKLYVAGAEKIIPNIKRLVDVAREGRVLLVSDACRHSKNDPEFQTFPPHCVRNTRGARIIPEGLAQTFYTVPNDESYELPKDLLNFQQVVLEKQTLDVFDNPHASRIVERLGKNVEYVIFGVVTEYCVRLAAKGLLARGQKVAIVKDAIETLKLEDGRQALDELKKLGARMITTDEAIASVAAKSPETARG
ncbi:MAG: cysteine hydrolase family protein [Candidatus Acidiferrales bacterium]